MRNRISFLRAFLMVMITASLTQCKKESAANLTDTGGKQAAAPRSKVMGTTSAYWLKAQETHNFVYGNLLTGSNSYRVNTTTQTGIAFEWYNVSQIYADAAMIARGDNNYLPYMNNTYAG
jgi:hypothetical protein